MVGALHEASPSWVSRLQGQREDWNFSYARKGTWNLNMLQGVTSASFRLGEWGSGQGVGLFFSFLTFAYL